MQPRLTLPTTHRPRPPHRPPSLPGRVPGHFASAFALLCMSVWSTLSGCGTRPSAPQSSEPPRAVFFDTQTRRPVVCVLDADGTPLDARPTLTPAMYCDDCRRWYPVPPLEQLNRSPGAAVCPRTRKPLSLEGPLPAD